VVQVEREKGGIGLRDREGPAPARLRQREDTEEGRRRDVVDLGAGTRALVRARADLFVVIARDRHEGSRREKRGFGTDQAQIGLDVARVARLRRVDELRHVVAGRHQQVRLVCLERGQVRAAGVAPVGDDGHAHAVLRAGLEGERLRTLLAGRHAVVDGGAALRGRDLDVVQRVFAGRERLVRAGGGRAVAHPRGARARALPVHDRPVGRRRAVCQPDRLDLSLRGQRRAQRDRPREGFSLCHKILSNVESGYMNGAIPLQIRPYPCRFPTCAKQRLTCSRQHQVTHIAKQGVPRSS